MYTCKYVWIPDHLIILLNKNKFSIFNNYIKQPIKKPDIQNVNTMIEIFIYKEKKMILHQKIYK